MFEVFFSQVKDKVLLSEAEQKLVKTFFSPKKIRKKQYLLQEGNICRHLAFVEKGLLRSYNVDEKGIEHMIHFAWEGWWMADMLSFLSNEPSTYHIDAIEEAELLLISQTDFEEMLLKVPVMERYFRILFQNNIISKERRLISSISNSAEEKYIHLTATNPELIKRIPQQLVASYLGITPETLSRIKKKLTKGV
ncbi:MAG: Crp/Fnr family transcriptional regulator [Chitinophagaceae bacterium]|jgi:CRP-like cAMP-binding protein|uniref:Crp/Fnr family transcriptional regulator n=1 Tax=Sediminibacterium sp. TaxID=1917865 RepID=UPI000BDBBEA3|nr:Crp/Fnr family transcriptional regulator [Sediminibacterium sp.]MBS4043798.1 Crp/Fnr family transcriptional regulator [Chitinophagaceae bacterium]OYY08991.1 MAG: cyclic nucleotide-binding protein [Sphingobacteriia bacterium 35-36-14]OYZ54843.1 MAG: cyclic nucleotide-binding protein [Sphingobacteriia bacterium 24-36-13]OZA64319.1 MAG: cyclic nucleotide-binding protein [Sphingobacteriia bacterium 39-36-14]HQS24131.1 Crp/Fnr family transcriptional regulator [Sediminibacterium sp.]